MVQCYIWMYKVTLKRNVKIFIRQFLSPIVLTSILILLLWPIYEISYKMTELGSLSVKILLAISFSSIYIQLSGTYDIINLLKSKIQK